MPGTPPTTPRYGAPRFTQSDLAVFTTDVNPIVDAFDNSAKLTELEAEIDRAELAESDEITARQLAITNEATARGNADTAEANLRIAGDTFEFVHVVTWTSEAAPTVQANALVGMVAAPVLAGQTMSLIGAASCCTLKGATPTVFKVQTDNGHGDGSLADATGLTGITPDVGRFVEVFRTSAGNPVPLALNRLDKIAVICTTPGASKGCALALMLGRTVP